MEWTERSESKVLSRTGLGFCRGANLNVVKEHMYWTATGLYAQILLRRNVYLLYRCSRFGDQEGEVFRPNQRSLSSKYDKIR
jgi:hypothetical protein